jgi:hypothetical protein
MGWGRRTDLGRTDGRADSPGGRAVIREGPAGRLTGGRQTDGPANVIWAVGFVSFVGIVRLQKNQLRRKFRKEMGRD